jgi:predicted negative regulator of RcsB-dependent stress response
MDETEQLETLKRWWNDYGLYVVGGLVIGLGSFFGWQGYEQYRTNQAERAAMLYEQYMEGREVMLEADAPVPPEMSTALEQLDQDYPRTSYRAFTLLFRAQDAVERGDYDAAAGYLRTLIDDSRSTRLRDVARLRLARVQHQNGDGDAALATLDGVSGAGFRAVAAEIKGDILLSKGDRDGARTAYLEARSLSGPDGAPGLLELKLADLGAGL